MASQFDRMFQALAVPNFIREFGTAVPYTKNGESQANTLTLIVTSNESRLAESNGFRFEVFRIHVSGDVEGYDPKQGDRLTYCGKTWDYAGLSREATVGLVGAFFESMQLQHVGPVDVSPI